MPHSDTQDLQRRIAQAQAERIAQEQQVEKEQQEHENLPTQGLNIGIEFVANMLLPAIVGYMLDGWLGTKPIIFLTFLILGIIGAFYYLYRLSVNAGNPVKKPGFLSLHKRQKDAKKREIQG